MTSAAQPDINAAILEGKLLWEKPVGEPIVGGNFVLLRELGHAYDYLNGILPSSKSQAYIPLGYQKILISLTRGELIAQTLGSNAIIPPMSWALNDASTAEAAFDSDFFMGEILRDDQCSGFVGELPVVEQCQASNWLRNASDEYASQQVINHDNWRTLSEAFEAQVVAQGQAKPKRDNFLKEFQSNSRLRGRGLTRIQLRKLWSDHTPENWKRPGAPKRRD